MFVFLVFCIFYHCFKKILDYNQYLTSHRWGKSSEILEWGNVENWKIKTIFSKIQNKGFYLFRGLKIDEGRREGWSFAQKPQQIQINLHSSKTLSKFN